MLQPITHLTYRRQWISAVMLSTLSVLTLGCGKKKPPQLAQAVLSPVNAMLSANPDSIQGGQSSTLSWSTQNASDVALEGNKVEAVGFQTVRPAHTTTYHLAAKGAGGSRDAVATVIVNVPPHPPPPVADPGLTLVSVTDIYFDYDNADLHPEAVQALARTAEIIKVHPNWGLQIQGNCDERGSLEYNLALGERRASAAAQALIQLGVNADQLKTISFGNEKPVCAEATEDCWQKNRRDHFQLMH